jgi:general stress protein YciG
MWSADYRARDAARRQGHGLSTAQVAEKVAEAARRERETHQQLDAPWGDRGPYAADPEHLAELWAAKHTEWRRIAALLETSGQHKYDPAQDVQRTTWAQEREAGRQGAVDRHAAWVT